MAQVMSYGEPTLSPAILSGFTPPTPPPTIDKTITVQQADLGIRQHFRHLVTTATGQPADQRYHYRPAGVASAI